MRKELRGGRFKPHRLTRRYVGAGFHWACALATGVGVVCLTGLLVVIAREGLPHLSSGFLTSFPSRFPELAGIRSALLGSAWLLVLVAILSLPLGIGAAVYLEEYATRNRFTRLLEANIANLTGVPSIVYGILGLAVFVRFFALDRNLLAGAATLSLLVLPLVITASQSAIASVPKSLREAAWALGATRWQVVRHHVLPAALPGILSGGLLALSRALGETAPLLMIGALTYVAFDPASPLDPFTALPIQIFSWASDYREPFLGLAAGGLVVLLTILLLLNAVAIFLRDRVITGRPSR